MHSRGFLLSTALEIFVRYRIDRCKAVYLDRDLSFDSDELAQPFAALPLIREFEHEGCFEVFTIGNERVIGFEFTFKVLSSPYFFSANEFEYLIAHNHIVFEMNRCVISKWESTRLLVIHHRLTNCRALCVVLFD